MGKLGQKDCMCKLVSGSEVTCWREQTLEDSVSVTQF